jgi:RNA polymerase sigma-70 factor (ECF subfamily)
VLARTTNESPPGEISGAALAPGGASPADFDALLRSVLDRAYGTALHLTRHRQDAEDLVQEASLHAFRAFHSFRPDSNFRAWFFRILVNCFYTSRRRRRRRHESSMDDLEDSFQLYLYARSAEVGLSGESTDPARMALDRLAGEDIGRALEMLPEEYRVVSTLYFLEDFSYQQIAEVLGVPVGTVRSRLHRGRRMLQKRLWTLAEDRGIVPTHPMEGP